jgi:hypothetical protein
MNLLASRVFLVSPREADFHRDPTTCAKIFGWRTWAKKPAWRRALEESRLPLKSIDDAVGFRTSRN